MGAMPRATLIIAAIALLCSTEAATSPPVTLSRRANVVTITANIAGQ
jgi:hypothetical protein